jgi:hypothetical protein
MSMFGRHNSADDTRFATEMLAHMPLAKAPDAVWQSIEQSLAAMPVPVRISVRTPVRTPVRTTVWPRRAIAAAILLAFLGGACWKLARRQWIETGPASVTLQIGQIGTVDVSPGTRLRIVADRPGEHRLALARGAIHARISAPPRLFFVDTAAGTAVDLRCEYFLTTSEDGLGALRVTKGWVSFDWRGIESLVPAGAMCLTKPHGGPGIPYFEDAPVELKLGVDDWMNDGPVNVDAVLAAARVRDTLTLWHLLSRVKMPDRGRVYDRIATLTPVPAGVSREKALQLDPETLKLWKDELVWVW